MIEEAARAKKPSDLLRARYVAYGIGAVSFLIASTDPRGSQWQPDRLRWERELRAYCSVLELRGLTVFEERVSGGGAVGFVRYEARLRLQGRDTVLAEAANYRKDGEGRWLYVDGAVGPGASGGPDAAAR